tara:strand:- start:12731 stop:13429 length:699 start_codon:yes stop_codon:yes gene_type:complete
MINLKVGEHNCHLPEQWKEIKLKDYAKVYAVIIGNEFVEPDEQPINKDALEVLDKERELHNVRTNRKVFSQLTGLSEQVVNQTDIKQMNETITLMTNFLNNSTGEYTDLDEAFSFRYKNKEYVFPFINMETNTFGDYIETAQLDMVAQKQDAKKMSVIGEQMAILCREKNEVYDEQLIQKKTKMFQELTMDIVWKFVFFLTKQINICNQNFQTYSKTETELKTDTQQNIGKL